MSKINNTSRSGLGFFSILTLIFIFLKLNETIDWSWWLVLLPVIIPIGIVLIAIAFFIMMAAIAAAS